MRRGPYDGGAFRFEVRLVAGHGVSQGPPLATAVAEIPWRSACRAVLRYRQHMLAAVKSGQRRRMDKIGRRRTAGRLVPSRIPPERERPVAQDCVVIGHIACLTDARAVALSLSLDRSKGWLPAGVPFGAAKAAHHHGGPLPPRGWRGWRRRCAPWR